MGHIGLIPLDSLIHLLRGQLAERVLSLPGLHSRKPHIGGTEALCPSVYPSNLCPSYSWRCLPLLKSLWKPPEASGGDSRLYFSAPEGQGPTIMFPQHLEESVQILGIPGFKTEDPVENIGGISHQGGHYQWHEVRILIIIPIIGDAPSPLSKGASHIMSIALLASKFGNLDFTGKSILFLMYSPQRGVTHQSHYHSGYFSFFSSHTSFWRAHMRWTYPWIPHRHRKIGTDLRVATPQVNRQYNSE